MKYIRIIIANIIGFTLLYFWYRTIDTEIFLSHIKNINYFYVLLSGTFYLLAYFVRSYRWKFLLGSIKKVSILKIYTLFMSGMMLNFIIPIRLGEVLKSYFLKKTEQVPMSKSLPTIFVNKMMDLLPVIVLMILLPFINFSETFAGYKIFHIVLGVILFFLILALLIVYYSSIHKEFFTKLMNKLIFWNKGKFKNRLIDFVENFIDSLHTIDKTVKNFASLFGFTLLAITLDSVYVWLSFKAFGFEAPFLLIFFGYTLLNLTYLFPTPPASIGSLEIYWMFIFYSMFGFDKDLVNAVVAFNHVFTGSIIIIVGLLSFNFVGIPLKSIFKFSLDKKEI
jgi:glycosyltransferase 2 family protein